MGQADAGHIARRLIKIEPERRALFQGRPVALEHANAQFRPLKVRQNADRAAGLFLNIADDPVFFPDLFVASVAHVQAENIRPGVVQCRDHLSGFGGWPKRGHDLYIAQTSHICSFVSYVPRANVNDNIACPVA